MTRHESNRPYVVRFHPIFVSLRLHLPFHVRSFVLFLSRLLLLLAAFELITMPVTQHVWAWDRFLRGGPDFELGLLIIVSCLCLMLLQAEQRKKALRLLLAMRVSLPNVLCPDLFGTFSALLRLSGRTELLDPPLQRVPAPLLI